MKRYRILKYTSSNDGVWYYIQYRWLWFIWITCRYWYKHSKGEGAFTSNLYYLEKYRSEEDAKLVIEDKINNSSKKSKKEIINIYL